jgi:hypothetical protein
MQGEDLSIGIEASRKRSCLNFMSKKWIQVNLLNKHQYKDATERDKETSWRQRFVPEQATEWSFLFLACAEAFNSF